MVFEFKMKRERFEGRLGETKLYPHLFPYEASPREREDQEGVRKKEEKRP